MSEVRLPWQWKPRAYQRALWEYVSKGGKRAVPCWHRRAGKDEVSLHHTACAAHERVGSYWYMLPQANQARKAMWDAVNPVTGRRRIDDVFPDEIRKAVRNDEMFIEFRNGSTFQLVGSDNFNSLVGSPPVGLIFSEYAVANPSAWAYLMPIVEENNGWVIFPSTPRGKNHFYALCESAKKQSDWFFERLTAADSGVFGAEQLERIRGTLHDQYGEDFGEALFQQEYYVSFDAAIPGAIWADCVVRAEKEGRILDYEIDRTVPVNTAWDLGRTDDTSIWFNQVYGRQIDVFEHHASNLKDVQFYVELLVSMKQRYGIRYGTHWLPHDARPRTLAAGGKSILQQFQEAGRKFNLGRFAIAPRLDRQEGIQAARATFPYCRFHKTACEDGLNSLKHYHREWDEEKKVFVDNPVHDWCLHGNTEVLTRYGTRRIMDLPENGEVLTTCGFKRYTNPRITRRAAPLVEVRFSDGLLVKCTPDHLFLTDRGWRFAENLSQTTLIQSSLTLSRSISMAVCIAYGQARSIFHAAERRFIGMLGKALSGLFQPDVTSIIATQIQPTTVSTTWNVYQHPSTCRQRGTSTEPERKSIFPIKREQQRLLGTGQKRAGYGTVATWLESRRGRSGSVLRSLVSIARKSSWPLSGKVAGLRGFAKTRAKWLHIESVRHLKETADVWCITVPGVENYSLSNGAVVHNSSHDADSFRMMALTWKFAKEGAPDSPLESRLHEQSVGGMSFGKLKAKHFQRMRRRRQEYTM